METCENKLSLMQWYSNGEKNNEIGDLLEQVKSIVLETSKEAKLEDDIEKTAIEWTSRKFGTLYLVVLGRKTVLGTISFSPERKTKNHARFGFLISKAYDGQGIEALALEKLLPTVKQKGYTEISGSLPDGDISYVTQWMAKGLKVSFDA